MLAEPRSWPGIASEGIEDAIMMAIGPGGRKEFKVEAGRIEVLYGFFSFVGEALVASVEQLSVILVPEARS